MSSAMPAATRTCLGCPFSVAPLKPRSSMKGPCKPQPLLLPHPHALVRPRCFSAPSMVCTAKSTCINTRTEPSTLPVRLRTQSIPDLSGAGGTGTSNKTQTDSRFAGWRGVYNDVAY
jgi:hypothetical protein